MIGRIELRIGNGIALDMPFIGTPPSRDTYLIGLFRDVLGRELSSEEEALISRLRNVLSQAAYQALIDSNTTLNQQLINARRGKNNGKEIC